MIRQILLSYSIYYKHNNGWMIRGTDHTVLLYWMNDLSPLLVDLRSVVDWQSLALSWLSGPESSLLWPDDSWPLNLETGDRASPRCVLLKSTFTLKKCRYAFIDLDGCVVSSRGFSLVRLFFQARKSQEQKSFYRKFNLWVPSLRFLKPKKNVSLSHCPNYTTQCMRIDLKR